MIGRALTAAALLTLSSLAASCYYGGYSTENEAPPEYIGQVTMDEQRVLALELFGQGPGGDIGHARVVIPPSDPRYGSTMAHIGAIRPGETKPLRPWPQGPQEKAASRQQELVQARYFVDPAERGADIPVIRRNTEPMATIDGHYSQAFVSCGTGCMAFWIVDRRTGAIIGVPSSSDRAEMIYEVQGRLDSQIVEVIYGPSDGVADQCRSRNFRLVGTTFTALGEFSSHPCP